MFQDASHLLAHNPPARHFGVSVADVGGVGRFAFVVAGYDGPTRVLAWTGGQFRDAAPPALTAADRRGLAVAAGDLDGDGVEELYVLTGDPSADRLLKRHPDGTWEDLFNRPENRPVRNLAAGRGVAALDRRGVGRYGFFVGNDGRPARLYELGPDGPLADLAPPLDLARAGGGRGVLAAPLFCDATDIYCTTEGGANLLFRNRGNGTFGECAAANKLADADEHGRGAVALDAGGGAVGLCWGNWDGPHRLMAPRAGGGWADRATPAFAFPSAGRAVVVADFDNDGYDELFFNNHGEPNRLFRLGPDAAESPALARLDAGDATEPTGFGTAAAVADLDGDGVLELLIAHGDAAPQPLGLYRARGAAANGWLRIRPLTRFGAPARGAVVRAEYGGRVRAKVIDGGSGYLCQMEPAAHFGLGRERRVDRVTVTWPDGASLTLDDPDVNCTYTVPYPGG